MRFITDEGGVTAIEYGLIAGLTAVMMITCLRIFGDGLSEMVNNVTDYLLTATS